MTTCRAAQGSQAPEQTQVTWFPLTRRRSCSPVCVRNASLVSKPVCGLICVLRTHKKACKCDFFFSWLSSGWQSFNSILLNGSDFFHVFPHDKHQGYFLLCPRESQGIMSPGEDHYPSGLLSSGLRDYGHPRSQGILHTNDCLLLHVPYLTHVSWGCVFKLHDFCAL